MSCPEPPMGISGVDSFAGWSVGFLNIFQLFRCRNLVLNRNVFPTLVLGMWGCQHRRHMDTHIHPYTPMHLYTPICPYTLIPPLYICMSPIPYAPQISWGHWGHLYTPYVMGYWGASVHLSGISLSVGTSTVSQFTTVIQVAPHHCGLLPF